MKYPFKCNVYLSKEISNEEKKEPFVFDVARMESFYKVDDEESIVLFKSGSELCIDATFAELVTVLENYIKQSKKITLGIN